MRLLRVVPLDNTLTVGIQPLPTGKTAEDVPRSDCE